MGEIIPRPQPAQALAFDGERFTTAFGGQTAIEHWHRYLLARELVRGRDVLDVACGEGYGSALLAQTARTVVGVDLSTTAVAHAQASYSLANLRYLHGSALEIPLEDDSVDMVVSFETIEHVREHDRFLKEIKRVLRSGGLLLISTPDRDNYSPSATPANPFHQLELTANEFGALLAHHFQSVKTQGQRVLLGSVLLGDGANRQVPLCFERRGEEHFEGSKGIARSKYLVALATDNSDSLPSLPDSVYVDTDQLFHVDGPFLARIIAGHPPPQAAESIDRLEARVLDLEQVVRQRDGELAIARKDLERRAVELLATEQERDRLAREIGRLEGAIRAMCSSTSWKVSKPLRWFGRILGRR